MISKSLRYDFKVTEIRLQQISYKIYEEQWGQMGQRFYNFPRVRICAYVRKVFLEIICTICIICIFVFLSSHLPLKSTLHHIFIRFNDLQ